MAKNIITGIDIGSSSVQVMVTEKSKRDGFPKVLGVGEAKMEGVRKGCVVNIDDVAQSVSLAVDEAEKVSGTSIKHVYLSLGGVCLSSLRRKGMVVVSRADSEITEHDIKRVIEVSQNQISSLVNKTIIHTDPINFTVDGEIITQSPMGFVGTKLEVETLFTAGLEQYIRNLVKGIKAAGLSADDVIASPVASARAVLSKRQKEVGVALLNIGASTTSIMVFEEGSPLSLEVFPFGSEHITNDLAIGFQLPMKDAEALKCNFTLVKSGQSKGNSSSSTMSLSQQSALNAVNKTKLNNIVEARLSDFFELVEKHLKKIGRSRLLPAGLVITGGGANLDGLAEFARHELELPVEIGIPQNIQSDQIDIKDPKWSVVAGLCHYGIEGENEYRIGTGFMNNAKGMVGRLLKSFLP